MKFWIVWNIIGQGLVTKMFIGVRAETCLLWYNLFLFLFFVFFVRESGDCHASLAVDGINIDK